MLAWKRDSGPLNTDISMFMVFRVSVLLRLSQSYYIRLNCFLHELLMAIHCLIAK